jgi:hypothetical protein
MRHERLLGLLAVLMAGIAAQPSSAADKRLCDPLKSFVHSVNAGETRKVVFNAIWGSSFKTSDQTKFFLGEKACTHDGCKPAKPFCTALVQVGSMEFPGGNADEVVQCLTGGAHKGRLFLAKIDATIAVGNDDKGQEVHLVLDDDPVRGGSVMTISVTGY